MNLTVVIPALNEEWYIPLLLRSLLNVGDPNMEVIVVDGRSEDQTVHVVEHIASENKERMTIHCVPCEKRNVSTQRNLGASMAAHDTILFLDADVVIPPDSWLEEIFTVFTKEHLAVASCRFMPLPNSRLGRLYFAIVYYFQRFQEKRRPYAMGAFLMVRKDVFQMVGGFDETIRVNEDAHFVERAIAYGRFRLFPQRVYTSTRRFDKEGYLRMGLRYVRIYLSRTFFGELRDDHIPYEFGKYK